MPSAYAVKLRPLTPERSCPRTAHQGTGQLLGLDRALDDRVQALTSSGLINAAANRAAMRVGQEPIELFREYMATYAHEQVYCHLSPALVRNLEEHWNADRRSL